VPSFVKDPSDPGEVTPTPIVRPLLPGLGSFRPGSPLREELGGRLFSEIRRRPARSLLIAAGTGFLAGGGLGASLTARVLGAAARVALRLSIVPVFVSALERAVSAPRSPIFSPSTTNNIH
jgi:hypothetical protein